MPAPPFCGTLKELPDNARNKGNADHDTHDSNTDREKHSQIGGDGRSKRLKHFSGNRKHPATSYLKK
jgi:hypothetical protein